MLCRNPFIRDRTGKVFHVNTVNGVSYKDNPSDFYDGVPFPCGQCLPCRINRRRVWTLRLMLESYFHENSAFITLTYSDENLPYNLEGLPCLCKRDFQNFMKRLRKWYNKKIRFYACGEYGSKTYRPHYHAILFGIAPHELDPLYLQYGGKGPRSPLLSLWSFGLVHVGDVSKESIQYVAGYVTKKFTRKGDGFTPEFSLMSRMPGIGAKAIDNVASVLEKYQLQEKGGRQLRIDGKTWPLGRYLLGKLSDITGHEFECTDYIKELSENYVQSRKSGRDFLEYLIEQSAQRNRQLDSRDRIFNKRDIL
uniref:Replication initiator protein n=2 Tax=Dulem virus 91 TaxID=3145802 RepID=A0AAU8B937_9VIRU